MTNDARKTVRLKGRLTVDEVPGVYAEHLHWKTQGTPAEINLAALEATDSSAVALLLEWLSWSRQAGHGIAFTQPPEALWTIAGLSGVRHLLGWDLLGWDVLDWEEA